MMDTQFIPYLRSVFVVAILAATFVGCLPQRPVEPVEAVPIQVDAYSMVRAHNVWRLKVRVPTLHWSKKLEEHAAQWVQELAQQGCIVKHSESIYGENIYWASAQKKATGKDANGNWIWQATPQEVTEQQVVASWASERQWYSHETNTCNAPAGKGCGHYTQIVWKNTSEVGCAKAICSDNSQVWVCNYAPAGNINGQSPY